MAQFLGPHEHRGGNRPLEAQDDDEQVVQIAPPGPPPRAPRSSPPAPIDGHREPVKQVYVTTQTASPLRVGAQRGVWLALGVAVAMAALEGLAHALEAINVGFEVGASIRSGILVAVPLIVAALRALEGRYDQDRARKEG